MVLLVKAAGHLLSKASSTAMLLLLFTVLHTIPMHQGKDQTRKILYQCKQQVIAQCSKARFTEYLLNKMGLLTAG